MLDATEATKIAGEVVLGGMVKAGGGCGRRRVYLKTVWAWPRGKKPAKGGSDLGAPPEPADRTLCGAPGSARRCPRFSCAVSSTRLSGFFVLVGLGGRFSFSTRHIYLFFTIYFGCYIQHSVKCIGDIESFLLLTGYYKGAFQLRIIRITMVSVPSICGIIILVNTIPRQKKR
jgi:hypothetical protein